MTKEIFTTQEAAEYLGMKETTLRNMVSAKTIPHYKSKGNRTYFDVKDLREYALAIRVPSKKEVASKAELKSVTA